MENPIHYYDKELFFLVNEGMKKLKVDDCIWAVKQTFSLDEMGPVDPIYYFAHEAPARDKWDSCSGPLYDILRVKKIVFGESRRGLFVTDITKAAELYVDSARYGKELQIIHPYKKINVIYWLPFASKDSNPSRSVTRTSHKIEPEYSNWVSKIVYATKADMVDFIKIFKDKRQKEQEAREAEEARRLEKLLEEKKRSAREINISLDEIWK